MGAKGQPLINSDRCKGCGLCIANCPKSILAMSEDLNAQGVTYPELQSNDSCIACTFCAIMCPENAIQIEKFETAR